MASQVRRGFTTLPVESEPAESVLDISNDFGGDQSDNSHGTTTSAPIENQSGKRKLEHLEDSRQETVKSAAPAAPKRNRATVPFNRPREDGEESDIIGDIFAGDPHTVANHKTFAHHLKNKLGYSHEEYPDPSGKGIVKPRRIPAQDDPENHAIKNLRVNEKLSWQDITILVNQERVKKGAIPDLTEAATYSRFVRNAPRIAAQEGDTDFDAKDYMHLKQKEMGKLDLGPAAEKEDDKGKKKWSRKADEILVTSYKAAKEEFWMIVAEKFELQSGRAVSPQDCAKRFKLL